MTAISDSIKKQMVEQMKADEMIFYFINVEGGEDWEFKKIKPD